MNESSPEPESPPQGCWRKLASDRRARQAAILLVQAIPLAAASCWPILESNRFETVGEPLFYALTANCCLLGAWAALSPAKRSRRASGFVFGYLAAVSLYAARMPYLEIDGMAFLGLSSTIVIVAIQAGRRFGLQAATRATITPGGSPRRQFSLASLMICVGLFALLCGVEGAVSKIREAPVWRPINVCLFSFWYASTTVLAIWFLLHERRLGKALGLSAGGILLIALAASFVLRRGPFGGYRFMEFAADAALELFAIAALELPALLLVRLQGVRLAFQRAPGPAAAGRGAVL